MSLWVRTIVAIILCTPLAGWSLTADQMEQKCKSTASAELLKLAKEHRCVLDDSTVTLNRQMSRQLTEQQSALWYSGSATCVIRSSIAEFDVLVKYSATKNECSLP